MSIEQYILDETGEPVVCNDPLIWATWRRLNPTAWKIEQTTLDDDTLVSTVFLGIVSGTDDAGRPLVFETMVFHPSGRDLFQTRYATRLGAIVGHAIAVEKYRKNPPGGTIDWVQQSFVESPVEAPKAERIDMTFEYEGRKLIIEKGD